jgi:purine-nucleoside/S-methyl-5'-thioadenosine phosphorylase / adenosine deaminase
MTAPTRLSLAARLAASGLDWIVPDWPAPAQVCALSTTRNGPGAAEFDLSSRHRGAEAAWIELGRWLPAPPVRLAQVHGTAICDADGFHAQGSPQADGAVARRVDTVCAVRSADCLPVLFTDRKGSVVAAAHAGWRGLAAGVLEAAVAALRVDPADVLAWLGPGIGPRVYEVGPDVFAACCAADPGAADCFARQGPGKWLADLYALAKRRLARAGVRAAHGGGRCTFSESALFHSHRRDGPGAGRMVTAIWIAGV